MEVNYCFTCEKSFVSMYNLNRHFRTKKHDAKNRLRYLRSEIEAEQISYGELAEQACGVKE